MAEAEREEIETDFVRAKIKAAQLLPVACLEALN